MLCPYCEQPVTDRVCPHCGAIQQAVPQTPAPAVQQAAAPSTPPVQIQAELHFDQTQSAPAPSQRILSICPRCKRGELLTVRRGYSWGLGLLGFFLFPVFGLLLGFIGAGKTRHQCTYCRKRF